MTEIPGALSQSRLRSLLTYRSSTGIWTWNVCRPGPITVAREAGTYTGGGDRLIMVDGKKYLAHRLAFLYMQGRMPAGHVKHINENKFDNRWANLQETIP